MRNHDSDLPVRVQNPLLQRVHGPRRLLRLPTLVTVPKLRTVRAALVVCRRRRILVVRAGAVVVRRVRARRRRMAHDGVLRVVRERGRRGGRRVRGQVRGDRPGRDQITSVKNTGKRPESGKFR